MKTKTVSQIKEEKNLQEMVIADKEKRANQMKAWIEEGLKKFNCSIEPMITVTSKGNMASLDIVAK